MRGCIKKILAIVLAIAMVVTLCPQMNITGAFAAEDEPYCISFGVAQLIQVQIMATVPLIM